ncbi:MAG: ABC transporter ATP-binding protein [Anaerolineaceae bacterium]|jgi:ABC-2 type transport system ATP-binding protein|nr:ABC transporter ATP-binding protein [Anaerolineaceae bacterium]
MGDYVIETHDLSKWYGDHAAVDGLNLCIRPGEIFGLLGPNGAGKTTTILMLLGLTEPTSGSVTVLGMNPARQPLSVKARVGYMPDEVGFYDELSARANLSYIAQLNGLSRAGARQRIDDALERVGLTGVADRPVSTFSRGMRRRLGVADVLLKEPQLVIMDEPTQGLDPEGAHAFLQTIRGLRQEGITVLLSSHLLHQVQAVCDRVGLFRKGRMELEGSVVDLAQEVLGGGYHIRLQADGPASDLTAALQALPGVVGVEQENRNHYAVAASGDLRAEAAEAVMAAGGRLLKLDIEEPSLDDIYTRYFEEVSHGVAS